MLTRGTQPPPQQQQQQPRPTEQDAGDLYQLVNMLQQATLTEQQRRHAAEDAAEMERLKSQGAKGYVEASSLTKELFPGSCPVQDTFYPLLAHTLQEEVFTKLLAIGSFSVSCEAEGGNEQVSFTVEEKEAPGNFTRTLYQSGCALDDHVASNIKDEANKLFSVAAQATTAHRNKALGGAKAAPGAAAPPPPPEALARFEAAVKMYTTAMASCRSDDTLAVLLNNRSTCFFNMGRVSASALDANASLMHKPNYWKALQRRGVCLKEMGSRRIAVLEELVAAAGKTTQGAAVSEATSAERSVFKQEAQRMVAIGESDEKFAVANLDNAAAVYDGYLFEEVLSLLSAAASPPPRPANSTVSAEAATSTGRSSSLLLQTPPSSLVLPLPNNTLVSSAPVDLSDINNAIYVDRTDAKKGRAVHAKHQLPKGATVLVETPYAVAPLNNNNSGYGVMTNRPTGGNTQSGPNSNQVNTGSSYCAMCMKRTDTLYPGTEYRTRALLPTLLPIASIATTLSDKFPRAFAVDKAMTMGQQLVAIHAAVKETLKRVALVHNGKKIDAALDKISVYVAAKLWELHSEEPSSALDIADLVASGAVPPSIIGVKSRGLFCCGPCATHSWNLYGKYESQNPYFLVCPIDTLLASRAIATGRANNGHNAINVRIDESSPSDHVAPLAIDDVGDNRFGAAHMDSLCAFTRETVPQLAEVGGKESVLCALACHFGISVQVAGMASSAPFYEQLRKAHRQVITNAFYLSCQDRVFISNPAVSATQQQHNLVTANVGKAMYAVASLFNHSCDPNCVVTFLNGPYEASGQLCIKVVRSVQEGEELTIQYGAVDKFRVHSTRGRIRALRAAHGFACACSSCYTEVDEPIKKEDEEYYHKASDYFQKGRRLTREGNFAEAINVLLQSYEIVMRYICPPPRPPQMMVPKTHDALAQAYLALSNGFSSSPAGAKETPQEVARRLREYHSNRAKAIEHLKAALALNLQLHKCINFSEPIPSVGITMGNNKSSSSPPDVTSITATQQQPPSWLSTHHPTNTTKMMSAAFLTSEHLDIGANTGIVEEYVRIAFLLAGEVESRLQTMHLSLPAGSTTGVAVDEETVLVSQREEAILFAKKAIELLTLYYATGSNSVVAATNNGSSSASAQAGGGSNNSVTSLSSEILRLEGVIEAMQRKI